MNEDIKFYIETKLRDALSNQDIIDNALVMMEVCLDKGYMPREIMRRVLADFVFNALDVDPKSLL